MLSGDRLLYLQGTLLCAALAAWFAWLFTPFVRRLAFRCGAVQAPRARDVHVAPIPKLGGVAIYLAFLAALAAVLLILQFVYHKPLAERSIRAGLGLITAGSLLSLLGAADDVWDLSAG